MLESRFQKSVIEEIKKRLPGVVILKNDPNYIQGFPDLTILHLSRWATLECKTSEFSHHQPNQDYYVNRLNRLGFSAFIFPENRKEVLDSMEKWLCEL